jgi:hypothetical protein
MDNETKFRGGIVMALLGFMIMTFEFFEKDRVYQEYKVTAEKQIDSLKGELQIQQLTTDHYDWLWTQLSELHPKDAEKIEHETE